MFNKDSLGNEYVEIKGLEAIQKNEQPSLKKGKESLKQGRIYATNCPTTCPVNALKLYLQKLPHDCDFLFYKMKTNWRESGIWYNAKLSIGVNTLGSLMGKISKDAQLSKMYTSHCVRPTVVTNLYGEGVPLEEISNVTGHKSIDSVKRYLRRVPDMKKVQYSMALDKTFNGNQCSQAANDDNNTALDCKLKFYSMDYFKCLIHLFQIFSNSLCPGSEKAYDNGRRK